MKKEQKLYPVELMKPSEISKADKVFALLLWCGFSRVDSYKFAYGSKGCNHSICTMASRKMSEEQIIEFGSELYMGEVCERLKFKML